MYVYLDFEAPMSPTNNLKTRTRREYLDYVVQNIEKITAAYAVGDGEVVFTRYEDAQWGRFIEVLNLDGATIVAHNSAFDVRMARQVLGFPATWPAAEHCTMDMARKVWPNQPGGYGLANLSRVLPITEKLHVDLLNISDEELEEYNKVDVISCRDLHRLELASFHAKTRRVHELAGKSRSVVFELDSTKAATAAQDFLEVANSDARAVALALDISDEDMGKYFGLDSGGNPVTAKYQKLCTLLNERGLATKTTSLKKMNHAKLAKADIGIRNGVSSLASSGKAMSYARRAKSLTTDTLTDLNYTFCAAHTGRPSGRGEGRSSLNALALPKHNVKVASIIRPLYKLHTPADSVFISADLANVEQRLLALVTKHEPSIAAFTTDRMADPYAAFWFDATGERINKHHKPDKPKRQIAKTAVLALGYLTGVAKFCNMLSASLADPHLGLSAETFQDIINENRWTVPVDDYLNDIRQKVQVPEPVFCMAYNIHRRFHEINPGIRKFAFWLVDAVTELSRTLDPDFSLENLYRLPNAPDRGMIDLSLSVDNAERTVKVRVGHWPEPILQWRNIGVRRLKVFGEYKPTVSIMHGRRGFIPFSRNLAIENCIQTLATVAMWEGKLRLDKLGYDTGFDIYDDCKLVVANTASEMSRAYASLLSVFGPDSDGCGYGWAVCIDPAEVAVSRTLQDWEPGAEWWKNPQPLESVA